jgi:hypothetical protein
MSIAVGIFLTMASAPPMELKDFSGYAKLVNHHDNANQILTMLGNMPESESLMICPGHKIKIIHHVHHGIKTAVMQECTNRGLGSDGWRCHGSIGYHGHDFSL